MEFSKDVINMLSYMLCPASKRCTLKEILSHPFLREDPKKTASSPKEKSSSKQGTNIIIAKESEEAKSSPNAQQEG